MKEICKKINKIIINELKEYINKFTNVVKLDEDIISLINHIVDELENAYDLCYEGNIVSSMILLRSTFENMLFSMNILYNPELLEEYKKIKNNIQPKKLKNEVIENWDKYFTEIMESKEQTEIEVKNIYDIFVFAKYPLAFVLIFYFIKLIYTLSPDKKIPSKSVNKGTIFTSITWILVTSIYSYYANNLANYDLFYGSLSNLVVLLIWVYIISYTFVLGIGINVNEYRLNENKN